MSFPPGARLAMAFMLALVFAWLLGMFWRQDRRQPALAEWSLACLLIAAAVPIRALLDHIPAWLSIGAANACVFLAFGCFWAGARRFRGAPPGLALRLGGTALWLALLPFVLGDIQLRVMLISLILGTYACLTAWEFRRGMRAARLASHPGLIGVFTLLGLFSFLRLGLAWHIGFGAADPSRMPFAPWNDSLAIAMLATFAGMAVMLVALGREGAEQHTAARLTEARDLADAANRNKTRFLARMSHELRTPLNAVFGMAQVLAQDRTLNPAQRDQAETLVRAGRHLLAIVNDTLDLARVEAGRLELAPRTVPLRETLRGTLDLIAGTAAEKHLALRLDTAPGLPAAVLADPVRLRQIVMNLLSNAVKFTPPDGTVALGANWEATSADPPHGLLRLSVTDTGPGVPDALRPGLFGEFAQGPLEAVSGEGSGLGLAISAALARAMGGSLTYTPGPDGHGSCFTAQLPVPLPTPASPAARPPAATPARPLRLLVLVVDDVRPNRLVARAMLEQAGHSVSEAADGAAALVALEQGTPPDAVLMDVNMHPLDGHAATRMIRAMAGASARVPVIAMTADTLPADLAACRQSGMNGHLAKPIDRATLLAELARVTAPG